MHPMVWLIVGLQIAERICIPYHGGEHTALIEAMRSAMKAIEIDPNLAEAHASLGLVLSTTGDYAGAEKEFTTAAKLNPNLHEAQLYWVVPVFHRENSRRRLIIWSLPGNSRPKIR